MNFLQKFTSNYGSIIAKRGLCTGASATNGTVKLSFDKYDTKREKTGANAPPLIVLHGLFGSKQNWRAISKRLNQDLNPNRIVYAVDARNHGNSPQNPNHSYEIMAEDLAHLYRHLGITKAALMGHSMGGRNVMYFALQYPELVEKAIIVDITQYYKSAHSKEVITMLKVLRDLKLDNSINLSEGRKVADEALKPVVPEKGTRDFVLLNLTKNADNNFEWRINLEGLQQNVTDNILKFPQKILAKKFTGPTLFVCGKESNYVSEKDVAKVKINFPRTQFEFIEKAGHLVHVDSPARFIDVTTKFLNEK